VSEVDAFDEDSVGAYSPKKIKEIIDAKLDPNQAFDEDDVAHLKKRRNTDTMEGDEIRNRISTRSNSTK
jgi:hypothetical protein